MRQITTLMVLFLLVTPIALANDERPAKTAKPVEQDVQADEEVVRMDAEEVFALVEQVMKDPKADRATAIAFLQKMMDGQVKLMRLEVDVAAGGNTVCQARNCRSKLCRRCDLNTGKCFCSNCCIAAAP